jgi:ATP-dependent RNA helicase SUPV3L1/SUV3
VFTDRLLRARGRHETLFLGSDTMRGAIAALVPGVQFQRRERFSKLTYNGSKKISRMPTRSAIVGFSVENVYAIAEVLRRLKGGAAVVMGALSPRTRNAQVAMYQDGEVDYLVATDAIGMGLNLDIRHVAFSSTTKFDGRRMRPLMPHELAQIAGRAGRYREEGTFGVTGEAGPLDEDLAQAIMDHRFAPIRRLMWRSADLDFGNARRLVASLEAGTENEWLARARESDDLMALRALAEVPDIHARTLGPQGTKLLWDVCRIPDFRGISNAEHTALLERIFGFLAELGRVPDDWLAGQVSRIDRTEGDIDTLSKRLAYIRTWTYVAQRRGWVDDEAHWRGATRAVEDRLSDALHGALTRAFVDRRTSVLLRRLKQKEALLAEVNDKGEVAVEGHTVGRLEGFRFRQDASATGDEAKTLRQAAVQALRPEFHLRADRFYNAPDTEIDYTEQGGLMWGDLAVGKLVVGPEPLRPGVEPFVDEDAGPEVAEKVKRRLQHFIDRRVATLYEPLLVLGRDEALAGLARGFAFRLTEHLGIIPREQVATEVKELDQEARGALRKHGVRFGQYTVFLPALLKPAPTRLRLVLWSLAKGFQEFPESPPPGLVTIPNVPGVVDGAYAMSGYRPAGTRAIRIDMLERLADILRGQDSRAGFEARADMLSITGMTLDQFVDLMQGLGYRATQAERPKARPASATAPATDAASETAPETVADTVTDTVAETETATVTVTETATETEDGIAPEGGAPQGPVETDPVATDRAAPVADVFAEIEPPEDTKADVDQANVDQAEAAQAGEKHAGEALADTAPVDLEVFYTFAWAGRPKGERPARGERPNRGPRREGGGQDAQSPTEGGDAAQPRGDRPRQDRGKRAQGDHGKSGDRPDRGGKPKGQHKSGQKPGPKGDRPPREGSRPERSFEARPPRNDRPKSDRIDPDNPFAAALMGLRDKL